MNLSVIIPAHNEEGYIGKTLDSVLAAAANYPHEVEIIVVLNRCTDLTESICLAKGCKIVKEDIENIAAVRNRGIRSAINEMIVTCDADSLMHPSTLLRVARLMTGGKYVGGGCLFLPERWSLGIVACALSVLPFLVRWGVSFGLFWVSKTDFEAIGGFDERFLTVEDLDFGKRLKEHGKSSGRKYGTLMLSPLITSCRKFDQFGDWYMIKNRKEVRRMFIGSDIAVAEKYWYRVGR